MKTLSSFSVPVHHQTLTTNRPPNPRSTDTHSLVSIPVHHQTQTTTRPSNHRSTGQQLLVTNPVFVGEIQTTTYCNHEVSDLPLPNSVLSSSKKRIFWMGWWIWWCLLVTCSRMLWSWWSILACLSISTMTWKLIRKFRFPLRQPVRVDSACGANVVISPQRRSEKEELLCCSTVKAYPQRLRFPISQEFWRRKISCWLAGSVRKIFSMRIMEKDNRTMNDVLCSSPETKSPSGNIQQTSIPSEKPMNPILFLFGDSNNYLGILSCNCCWMIFVYVFCFVPFGRPCMISVVSLNLMNEDDPFVYTYSNHILDWNDMYHHWCLNVIYLITMKFNLNLKHVCLFSDCFFPSFLSCFLFVVACCSLVLCVVVFSPFLVLFVCAAFIFFGLQRTCWCFLVLALVCCFLVSKIL